MAVLIALVLPVGSAKALTTLLQENFEGLTAGALNGQNGWKLTARYNPGANNDKVRVLVSVDGGAFTDVLDTFGNDNDGIPNDRNFDVSTRDADGFYNVGTDFATGTINALFAKTSVAQATFASTRFWSHPT